MSLSPWRKILVPLLLSVLLVATSCAQPKEPSRFDAAQQQSTQKGATPAVVKESEKGGNFNKFFPKSGSGYQTQAAQEKKGFAEYKLKKGGKDVAVLSISDTLNTPTAAQKYQKSTQKIGGYPAVKLGNGTSILVGRYQVKVQSRDPSFTESDREAWLTKFNLSGLAGLK